VGPSYSLQSLSADAQVCRNWYPELDESQKGKSAIILLPTPGLSIFASDPNNTPVRGEFTVGGNGGRTFVVIGPKLWEVLANGTLSNPVTGGVNTLANDGTRVAMCSGQSVGGLALLIASAGTAYVLTLVNVAPGSTNVLTTLTDTGGAHTANGLANSNPIKCAYIDGFFILLFGNSNQIQVSDPADAVSWDPGQVTNVSVFSDNILTFIADHRLLWMFGPKQSVDYYDAGGVFPLSTDPAGIIEQGICGSNAVAQFDNTVAWVSMNDKGQCRVFKLSGYTPSRISNHAVETALASYSTIADCIAYSYEDQGHYFLVLYFPTANHTWVFDAATNMWHERDHWNPATGKSTAHLSQGHTFNFGTHLVSDWNSGTIYAMSINTYADNGGPIRRVRRAPHISTEQQWIFHHYMQVDVEVGLGPQPPLLDGYGNPRDPEMMLRWSNDGAKTWSKELIRKCGQAGHYKKRAMWKRLGKSRDRVYEIAVTDPIPWRIADAYLAASPSFDVPTETLAKSYNKLGQ
jgi:hypothetical protein